MHASSKIHIDDVRIKAMKELAPPAHVLREFPATPKSAATTFEARSAIHRILFGADDRLLSSSGRARSTITRRRSTTPAG